VFVCFVQRNKHNFERCSSPHSNKCIVSSPFAQADDDGILNVTVNGSNRVGQESTSVSLQLNDIGLQCLIIVLLCYCMVCLLLLT